MNLLLVLLGLACAPAEEAAPADADGDGYSWFTTDCDDADPEVHPGAEDAWYDGLDADCAGNDDNDADGDGSPVPADCDDEDAARQPEAIETAGDALDADCDGEPDGAPFIQLTTVEEDSRGPRLASLADGSVGLMRLDETPSARYRRWNPSSGDVDIAYATLMEGYEFGVPLAFSEAGDNQAVATTVYYDGWTYLALVLLESEESEWWNWAGRGWETEDLPEFSATDVGVEGDVLTVIGCARGALSGGPVLLLRGNVADYVSHEYHYAWARSGSGGDTCVLDGDDVLLLDGGDSRRVRYDGSSELVEAAGWGPGYVALAAGGGLLAAARKDEIELRESADDEPVVVAVSEPPDLVRVARAPDGSARVLWRSGDDLWLYSSVTDESTLVSPGEEVLDAAIVVSTEGAVVVAVRTATAVWVRTVLGG